MTLFKSIPRKVNTFAYCRISDENDTSDTLENQESIIREIAEKHNNKIVKVFKDKKSGKDFNRQFWKDMIKEIPKYNIKIIYVKRYDRVARNKTVYKELEKINKLGADIISVTEPYNEKVRDISWLVSSWEREDIRDRILIGIRETFKTGKYIIKAPLGYKKITVIENGKVIDRRLEPIQEEINFIKKIFKHYAKTKKLYKTHKRFLKQGKEILQKKIQREGTNYKPTFSLNYLKKLLSNPIYIGYLCFKKKGIPEKYLKLPYLKPIVSKNLFYKINPTMKEEIKNKLFYFKPNTK